MKMATDKSSGRDDNNKSPEMDLETVKDIMERINGLSYDGQREIIAYLKTRFERAGKGKDQKSEAPP